MRRESSVAQRTGDGGVRWGPIGALLSLAPPRNGGADRGPRKFGNTGTHTFLTYSPRAHQSMQITIPSTSSHEPSSHGPETAQAIRSTRRQQSAQKKRASVNRCLTAFST